MKPAIAILLNTATSVEITEHLSQADFDFVPPLSNRVNLAEYGQKIATNAVRYEAWADGLLVGMVAGYCNDPTRATAFITSVSILQDWRQQGIARRLLLAFVVSAKNLGFQEVTLEVARGNITAVGFYEGIGFSVQAFEGEILTMALTIASGANVREL